MITAVTLDWPKTSAVLDWRAGRAKASASNASSRQRSASRIMSSTFMRRWFCSTLILRNRIAAQTTFWNFRRLSR